MDLYFNKLVSKLKLPHIYDGSTTEILIYTYEQYEQYLFNIQYDSSKNLKIRETGVNDERGKGGMQLGRREKLMTFSRAERDKIMKKSGMEGQIDNGTSFYGNFHMEILPSFLSS